MTPSTEELRALLEKATPGPWSIESCGEKGDGANMIGVAFDSEADPECKNQLSGWLPLCRPITDEFIEYYRDELVAECDFHNRNSGYDAELIALSPSLAEEVIRLREEVERLTMGAERAESAERRLKEIVSTVDGTATIDHLHCKLALDRIKTIATEQP